MSAATRPARSPRAPSRPVGPAVATRLAHAAAGGRPLDSDEFSLARFVVRRWTSARAVVAKLYGSADPTSEYRAAVRRYESFGGDDLAYVRAARADRDLLAPEDMQSYARFAALTVAEPRTVERAVWSMLRAAEVDVIRLIEALNAEPDGTVPSDRADLTFDGRRFFVGYLDDDRDPRDARLIVGDVADANPGGIGRH